MLKPKVSAFFNMDVLVVSGTTSELKVNFLNLFSCSIMHDASLAVQKTYV